MEKQANNLQSKTYMKLFSATLLVFFTLFFTHSAKAQTEKDSLSTAAFEKDKEYILGGISVTGLKKFSEETVKVFTV